MEAVTVCLVEGCEFLKFEILKLNQKPEMLEEMAQWFSEKWSVPLEAYKESMHASLKSETGVPGWYVMTDEGKIVGGLGVIENDFHDRKDLTPNVCAVYVEPTYRCQGIAGILLDHVCEDMNSKGKDTLYLLTDHDSFYERYGWKFLCMVQGDDEKLSRMYVHRMESCW